LYVKLYGIWVMAWISVPQISMWNMCPRGDDIRWYCGYLRDEGWWELLRSLEK
jgi:hypothetical protein